MPAFADRVTVMAEEVAKLKVLSDSLIMPDIISFAAGAPALEAYPFDQLREIAQDILRPGPSGYEALKYGGTSGTMALREQIIDKLLAPRGVSTTVGNLMVTAGGIQPMNLLCQLYIDPGDTILVETPSFVHTSMIYKMFQARLVPCAMDDDGLVIEDVEAKIKACHPKFIYTVPTFQNPTGITMSGERRQRLAELASRYDVLIIEDDPYREIRYSGQTLPYIKSFDRDGHTILVNSFSKIFSPGVRLGYLVADEKIVAALGNIKLGTDTCSNTLSQGICAEFFRRGHYPAHLKRLCDMYRSRRDVMMAAIDASFPAGTTRTTPDGGYYVWVELPRHINASALKGEVAREVNACYGDGAIFFTEGNPAGLGTNCMRLNFSGLTEETIDTYTRKLGAFFCQRA